MALAAFVIVAALALGRAAVRYVRRSIDDALRQLGVF